MFPGKMQYTHLLVSDREPMTDRGMEIRRKSNRNMHIVLLIRAERTQLHQDNQGPLQFSHLEIFVHYMNCRNHNRLESVPSMSLSCSKPLPGISASFCFYQSSLQLFPPENFLYSSTLLVWGGLSAFLVSSDTERPCESPQFPALPEDFDLFIFLFKELPCRMEHFSLRRNCYRIMAE